MKKRFFTFTVFFVFFSSCKREENKSHSKEIEGLPPAKKELSRRNDVISNISRQMRITDDKYLCLGVVGTKIVEHVRENHVVSSDRVRWENKKTYLWTSTQQCKTFSQDKAIVLQQVDELKCINRESGYSELAVDGVCPSREEFSDWDFETYSSFTYNGKKVADLGRTSYAGSSDHFSENTGEIEFPCERTYTNLCTLNVAGIKPVIKFK